MADDDIYGLVDADWEDAGTDAAAEPSADPAAEAPEKRAVGKRRGGTRGAKTARKKKARLQELQDLTCFVTNLPANMTEIELRTLAATYGEVKDLRLARDEQGRPKGFAHVDFLDLESATAAVNGFHGMELREDAQARILLASHAGDDPPEFVLPQELVQ